jgi:hypothetical protein
MKGREYSFHILCPYITRHKKGDGMDKTVTIRKVLKGLPEVSAPAPQSVGEIDKQEKLRAYREKAKLRADGVIRRFREELEAPKPARPVERETIENDSLIH